MRNRVIALLLAAALIVSLAGCGTPAMELNRRLIIEAIGIDADADGVRLTLRTLDAFYGSGTTEGGDRKQAEKVYVFAGGSVAEAIAGVPEATGLVPLFSQVRLVAISRDTARRGAEAALTFLVRETRLRPDVPVCVAEEEAQALIGADLGASAGAAVLLEEALRTGQEAGTTVCVPLYRFLSLAQNGENAAFCPVLALASDGADGLRPAAGGIALFAGDRLTAVLPQTDAAAFLLLTENLRGAVFPAYTEAGERFSFRLLRAKTRVRFRTRGQAVSPEIVITAKIGYSEETAKYTLSEEEMRAAAEKTLNEILEHCIVFLKRGGFDPCRLKKRIALRAQGLSADPDSLYANVMIRTELLEE